MTSSCKLPTFGLYHRRQRGDMIDTHKYLTVGYATAWHCYEDPGQYDEGEQKTRGHNLKLHKSRSRLDVIKYFFSQWLVNLSNNLPKEVVEAPFMDFLKTN